jgi:Rrf2 family nitric oxide-sensitive transcriptional repressor
MRLTTRTNLAVRVLMTCGVNAGMLLRTADIAQRCNASVHHLLQVVNLLQDHGFVETQRGRSGGLKLTRPPEHLVIGEVFRVFESKTPFAECFDAAQNTCPLAQACRLRGYIQTALDAFYQELDKVTLQDLLRGNCGLEALLHMSPLDRARCDGPTNQPG